MWRNYLTVGLRSLLKSRTYAFINIVGLAIGLAACLMLLLYVRYERSYDSWLPNSGNVYQLQTFYRPGDSGEPLELQMSSYAAGIALQRDFPQVERRVYMLAGAPTVIRGGEAFNVEEGRMVDGPFFDIFRMPFVHGDPATALRENGTVVLSRSQANRIFGNVNPVGQTLSLDIRGTTIDHRVTGVVEDLPRNSHMRFNMLVRFDPAAYFSESPNFMTEFGWQTGWVYVQLRPGTDPETIHAQMPAWERRNIPDETVGDTTVNQGDDQDYRLVNVADVHLGRAQEGSMTPGNDRRSILTFAIIAALILGMAIVNFTNLATARASQRAREVALRKVLGASRRQLVVQFLSESTILVTISMLLGLALVELLLPALSAFLDADLQLTYFGAGGILLPMLGLVLVVGAVGGLYPAFYLSRYQPAQVLKANKSSAEPAGSGRLRSALVVAQFAVSIGLIICTVVVYAQTVFARSVDPGFRRDGLIQLEYIGARKLADQREAIVREVGRIPGVTSVSRTGIGISTPNTVTTGVPMPGRPEPLEMGSYPVEARFFETMGVELIAGRTFDPNRPGDEATVDPEDQEGSTRALVARGLNVVINELAARRLGFSNPRDAVGRQFRASIYDSSEYGVTPITVIGVVEDSRFRTVHSSIEPIIFRYSRGSLAWMVVRYQDANPTEVRDRIQQVWRRFANDVPFEANFSEDIVAELYEAEAARAQTFAGFALLAVVVACLGLFGLAAFTAERRTKEIGIRKVFGARSRDIVRLLAWQFSKPVIVANLIAWPVAWWVMRDWLNNFDARIDLGPTPFVLAGALALAIAIGTIAGHALKVARANPIHALRYE
ncbi:MAG TPA: ABC transporter permease [Allosphingosinicella sp.]|nr:ABC transporter permease [Allosphingosinicella sp.]